MKKLATSIISFYKKVVSPILVFNFGHACRYTPTCAEYSKKAIERFGLPKGIALSLKRISKCHPFGGFGHDPVPKENF